MKSGWQPIETAPRDGSHIWLYSPGDHQCEGFYLYGREWEGWQYADELLQEVAPEGPNPTHWQPLPPPPGE